MTLRLHAISREVQNVRQNEWRWSLECGRFNLANFDFVDFCYCFEKDSVFILSNWEDKCDITCPLTLIHKQTSIKWKSRYENTRQTWSWSGMYKQILRQNSENIFKWVSYPNCEMGAVRCRRARTQTLSLIKSWFFTEFLQNMIWLMRKLWSWLTFDLAKFVFVKKVPNNFPKALKIKDYNAR